MSREILFRAKAINRDPDREYRTNYKNGDWVYGLVTTMYDDRVPKLPAEMKTIDGVSGVEIDGRTIGQYTGLTDRNGVKIFEGDVVRISEDYYDDLHYSSNEVYYSDGAFCVEYETPEYDVTSIGFLIREGVEVEIIGNIYDNLELITVVEKSENESNENA